jgi:predicted RND superfamily exporter protein
MYKLKNDSAPGWAVKILHSPWLIVFVLLVAAAYSGLAIISATAKHPKAIQASPADMEIVVPVASYDSEFSKIMEEYFASMSGENSKIGASAEQTRSRLLELRVSADKKEAHLKIVLSLDEIIALSADAKTAAALSQQEELQKYYNEL